VFGFYDSWKADDDSDRLVSKLNLVIKNVSGYYDSFGYRKATIELRELFGLIEHGCSKETAESFLKLIAPICPHVAEELWSKMGHSDLISVSDWPEFRDVVAEKKEVDLNGKIASRIKEIVKSETKKVYVYVMPFEIGKVDAAVISKGVGLEVEVFAVNDSSRVDPKGMAKRAKPGIAAVYLE